LLVVQVHSQRLLPRILWENGMVDSPSLEEDLAKETLVRRRYVETNEHRLTIISST
jgi:hypothetical protein